MLNIVLLLGAFLCAVVLFLLGWFLKDRFDRFRRASAEQDAKRLIEDAQRAAENLKRERLLEVKDDHLRLKTQLENDFETKRAELNKSDRQLRERERILQQKVDIFEKRSRDLKQTDRELRDRVQKVEADHAQNESAKETAHKRIEELAHMTHEDALAALKVEILERARLETIEQVRDLRERAKMQANREAKELIVQAIQRSAADHSAETTVTVVNIPSDEIKGRIIGREGRNIRSFESITGVEVIVDDTPEAVTLSGFDPYRREVARIALEMLIADGRIHPARIEEVVKKAQKDLDEHVIQLGEQASMEAGVDGMHPEIIRHLGKLHYRTSYGQNVLKHSIEVSRLAALMAAELELDAKMAARAGLLHDIGKAIDRNAEGTHTELGVELARRFREPKVVLNAIASHHEDVESTSLIACLVQAADAISGSRPGARRDSIEGYVKRLEKLEEVANSFSGVTRTFALQAGREVRVMVENENVSDAMAQQLAADIAKRIHDELEYPGQIRVVVIREFRAVEFAR